MRVALAYLDRKLAGYGCMPPLGLLYLATCLREHNVEVAVFDPDAYTSGLEELLDKVVDFKPDIVGMSIFTRTDSFQATRAAAQRLREKLSNISIVAGGPHPSACPQQTLQWFPEVDFVLQGEAEYTLCKLADQLKCNVAVPEAPGLSYRTDGAIISISPDKPPKDLDGIPIPDRKLLWDNYRNGVYWRIDRRGMADTVVTGRGCPFNCKFCFKLERGYRGRSPENVVEELVYLASLGIKNIEFEDDLFTINKARCIEICRLIQDAGLSLTLKARSRVDTIDEEMLAEMRKSGVCTVTYGFESGSQMVLDAMNKRISVARNYAVVQMTKKAGLRCYADMFLGFPGETPETIAETTNFLLKARPSALNMSILAPFPATQVYAESKANRTLVGDWTVDGPAPYVKLPWAESHAILIAYHRRVLRRYYFHPAVMFGVARICASNRNPRSWLFSFGFFRRLLGI